MFHLIVYQLRKKSKEKTMSDNRDINEKSVDRRAETVVTEQPGYAATEQVTRDVAAERRLKFLQIDRIMYTLLGILEILLGLRFVLKLIAANPDSGFSVFIYGITGFFLAPFNALVGTPAYKGSTFEFTTLIGMAVYALLFWVLVRIIQIAAGRTTARTVTRSTREQNPPGGMSK
jgi:YggT family protein